MQKTLPIMDLLIIFIIYYLSVTSLEANIINRKPSIISAYGLGEPINSTTGAARKRPTIDEYYKLRQDFMFDEEKNYLGANLTLNDRELLANTIIMKSKNDELNIGFLKPHKFAPAQHFFEIVYKLGGSKLFEILKAMPKGGVLHAHDTALCSTDYVISLTYRPNLWQCLDLDTKKIIFKFSEWQPKSGRRQQNRDCEWKLVEDERKKRGKGIYDNEIRKYFSLYTKTPQTDYKDINEVWNRFARIFETLGTLVTYEPVWRDYFKRALKEFLDDGVQYLEFRGTLPQLYDLNGTTYTMMDSVQIYYDIVNEFKKENSEFIGAKFIYAPYRKVDDKTFAEYMKTILQLQEKFPTFVAGFDIVAQEDLGRPLLDFASYLLSLPDSVNFFFHAGETNWNGMATDENLIDAILLGTKRIGHGYAAIKHPKVLEKIKEQGIAIEINPISNQVLKLNDDNRNHPCTFLLSQNYPVVISSDDPSLWEAKPLSHDFYMAFLGIASSHSSLKTLKQLAINSLGFSSLSTVEREFAYRKWERKWNNYIEWIILMEHRNEWDLNDIK